MLLLAFAGLGASCSDDVESGGGSSIAGRTELQIAFSGNGESQEYTKAAASESENEIKDLKIYLFAANAENGEYQYLETWEEGQPYNPDNADVTKFKKQASGTSVKASEREERIALDQTLLCGQQRFAPHNRRQVLRGKRSRRITCDTDQGGNRC